MKSTYVINLLCQFNYSKILMGWVYNTYQDFWIRYCLCASLELYRVCIFSSWSKGSIYSDLLTKKSHCMSLPDKDLHQIYVTTPVHGLISLEPRGLKQSMPARRYTYKSSLQSPEPEKRCENLSHNALSMHLWQLSSLCQQPHLPEKTYCWISDYLTILLSDRKNVFHLFCGKRKRSSQLKSCK